MTHPAIARLLDQEGVAVGYGIVTSSGHILAASSGVRRALGGSKFSKLAGAPTDLEIVVDYPFSSDSRVSSARIVRWESPRDSGPRDRIATLKPTSLPKEHAFVDASRDFDGETSVSLSHIPSAGSKQHEIAGTLVAAEGYTWWVIALPSVTEAADTGLAGAPLWDTKGNLAGLTLGQIPGSNRRYVAPPAYLIARDVPADERAGSPKWELNQAMNAAPRSLVQDLRTLEADGLDLHECDQVKFALRGLADELVALESAVPFSRPPSDRANHLYDVYDTWNGGDKGEPGRAHRRTYLAGVDDSVHALGRSRTTFAGNLYDESVAGAAARVMDLFKALPLIVDDQGRTRFPEVRRQLSKYRRRR